MAKKQKVINVIIGHKCWQMTYKMAQSIIDTAREKYIKEGTNAIVAVQKGDVLSLMKDTFESADEFIKAISKWERGGYKCFYTVKKEEEK